MTETPEYWRLYYKVQGMLIRMFGDRRGYQAESEALALDLLDTSKPVECKLLH